MAGRLFVHITPLRGRCFGDRSLPIRKGEGMGEFIGSTMFFVIGGLIVAGLVGLLIFLRMRPKDED